jgi:small conductance mechanosensitive channel
MPQIRPSTVGAILLAFIVAAIVVRVAHVLIQRVLGALDIVGAENRAAVHARAQQLKHALTLLAYGVAALAVISMALDRFGVKEPQWDPRLLGHWLLTHGVNLVLIAASAFIVVRALNLVIEHLRFKLLRRQGVSDLEWERRAATLGGILTSVVTVSVGFIAILMLLRELSVDVLPILTGAGIAGLAIGFGAQNLVRDVISGFFLILEDQVRIGDLARINGVTGIVEQINLRTIVLRDGTARSRCSRTGRSRRSRTSAKALRVPWSKRIVQESLIGDGHDPGSRGRDGARRDWAAVLGPARGPRGRIDADGAPPRSAEVQDAFLTQGRVANELRRRLMGAFVGRGIKPYA